jgi:hypothetical protein
VAVVAVIPVIFYAFIAWPGVAEVRSTIMVLSFLLALLPDRERDFEAAKSTTKPKILFDSFPRKL